MVSKNSTVYDVASDLFGQAVHRLASERNLVPISGGGRDIACDVHTAIDYISRAGIDAMEQAAPEAAADYVRANFKERVV